MNNDWIKSYLSIRKDFPKPGVSFYWYGKLLRDPQAFHQVIQAFAGRYKDQKIDVILTIEARGFIFGSALAYALSLPLVLVRKCGRLPEVTHSQHFELEYGVDCLEVEKHALQPGQQVLILDDLLATGGSAEAASQLAKQAQAEVVEIACLLEMTTLEGKSNLSAPFFSLFQL